MDLTYLADSYAVSAQLQPEQMQEIADLGFIAVVCNRPDNEEPGQPSVAEMSAACSAAGMEFTHIPMVGPNYTTDDVNNLKSILAKGKVFGYCRSGNRSSILWNAAQQ